MKYVNLVDIDKDKRTNINVPWQHGKYYLTSLQINNKAILHSYVRVPRSHSPNSKIIVAVHGITRKPLQMITLLAKYADRNNAIIVAPLYDKSAWKGYQQLHCKKSNLSADQALLSSVSQIKHSLGLNSAKFSLIGFSGGGQFAHRFAYIHPNQIDKIVAIAPGWFTYPDDQLDFPLGTRLCSAKIACLPFNNPYRTPTLIVVGSRDCKIDKSLNTATEITRLQGANRVQRAQNWVAAMRAYHTQIGMKQLVDFSLLNGVSHSFKRCIVDGGLGDIIEEYLFGV